jgi:hypothetical protein
MDMDQAIDHHAETPRAVHSASTRRRSAPRERTIGVDFVAPDFFVISRFVQPDEPGPVCELAFRAFMELFIDRTESRSNRGAALDHRMTPMPYGQ